MNAKEYFETHFGPYNRPMEAITCIKIMEDYHQAKLKEELPTEEEMNGIANAYSKHPITGKIDKVQRKHYTNGIHTVLRLLKGER